MAYARAFVEVQGFFVNLVNDIGQHWLLYAVMPVVAAVIGYVTKVLAVRMMFGPLEFVGIRPFFGWQGVIPRRAPVMASTVYDTLTQRLLVPEELFGRIDPERVARELEIPLRTAAKDIVEEVAAEYGPTLWETLPHEVRNKLIERLIADTDALVAEMMEEVRRDLDNVFDMRDMLVSSLTRDKQLLNRIFLEAGNKEFEFIRRSGIYFGFLIGIVQVLAWSATHALWIMPAFGGFIGWFSDWLALRMVFFPREPRRYLGVFKWQGLFQKRRQEVASAYGRMMAEEVLTARNLFASALTGRMSDRMSALVERHVNELIERQLGFTRPLVVLALGGKRLNSLKADVAARLLARMPNMLRHAERYVDEALAIRETMVSRMQELTPEEFEKVLRPVFQQDEWKLIATGAVLGFIIGELQVQVMLHG